ncbi:hypothetical protein [Novosphingobium rosa]|uniref:hypothetical protein n=1 Tax=Novosphingobium rosa TaxID=76978 RepID=UPI0008376E40|nr:hypothetical protein [Novosphingobium rosa]
MVMAIFWLLWGIAAVGSLRWIIYLFFAGIAFGATNTLPGGVNLLPATACVPLLVWRVLRAGDRLGGQPGQVVDAMLNWRVLGLLTAYSLIALVVTCTAPRLFAGVPIVELNTLRPGRLHFGPTNITQICYMLGSYGITLATCVMVQSREGRRLLAEGLQVGALALIVTGTADATVGSAPLSVFKTAKYGLILDASFDDIGMRRVVGVFSEASAYGAATLALAACLIFIRPAREFGGLLAMLDIVLGLGLELMTYLSTSSGAVAGLGLMVAAQLWFMLSSSIASADRGERGQAQIEVLAALVVMAAVAAYLIMAPDILGKLYDVIDRLVLKKGESASYIERSGWTRDTFRAVMLTWGYGIGAGASRASNWGVAVLAASGAVGAAMMGGFFMRCMLARLPVAGSGVPLATMGRGGRYALAVAMIPAMGSATTADYGAVIAVILAVAAAAPLAAEEGDELPRFPHPRMGPAGAPAGPGRWRSAPVFLNGAVLPAPDFAASSSQPALPLPAGAEPAVMQEIIAPEQAASVDQPLRLS